MLPRISIIDTCNTIFVYLNSEVKGWRFNICWYTKKSSVIISTKSAILYNAFWFLNTQLLYRYRAVTNVNNQIICSVFLTAEQQVHAIFIVFVGFEIYLYRESSLFRHFLVVFSFHRELYDLHKVDCAWIRTL